MELGTKLASSRGFPRLFGPAAAHMRQFATLAVSISISLAIACGGRSLPQPEFGSRGGARSEEVRFPPPPARVEVVPEPPSERDVWVDGEWVWQGGQWAWQRGYWSAPPEGATFSPPALKRTREGTFHWTPGTWRNAKGMEIDPPPPSKASARAREGVVVTAEGDNAETGPNLDKR